MRMLKVRLLPDSDVLADWCRRHGQTEWGRRGCCPFPATDCPLGRVECQAVTARHWEALGKEEADGEED